MFLQGTAVDQDVIHKYQDKFPNHIRKYCVHKTLEGGWGIGKSKGHHLEFI